MGFTLSGVEALAPDQPSLKAASGLAKPGKWLSLTHDGDLWWGECQGSGANPYRAVVDSGVVGYKCTCPSRKFPCKHALALMWLAAANPQAFSAGQVPAWVTDWLGRRRTSTPTATPAERPARDIGVAMAATPDEPAPEDPAALAKRQQAALKRAESTSAMIRDGLDDLDTWIHDQLTGGLTAFVDRAPDRCRKIAARLSDHKATALASRLDELPSRLLTLPAEDRPDVAVRELGKLVLLAAAWRANPADPQTARDVGASEKRDDVLANPEAPRVTGRWEVLGEQIRNRRDGLVSHSAWFLRLDADDTAPRFALLLDFYPASSGRPESSFTTGTQYEATMVYYPSHAPLRALALDMREAADRRPWPAATGDDPLADVCKTLEVVPWQQDTPLLLPPGRVVTAGDATWWRADSGAGLPIAADSLRQALPQILGMPLPASIGIWDGARLTLLAGETPFGRGYFA
ncbi:MAG: SWIM zinc finger family protein [Actinomycetia bacterium]|nr:SWIM zinc finger family protein [Actinomycetes bacterium]